MVEVADGGGGIAGMAVVVVADGDGGGGGSSSSGGGEVVLVCKLSGGGGATKRRGELVGAWTDVDAVLQSSLYTRMLRSVVRIAAQDGMYTVRVYREMATDFVKYSSRSFVVVHRMLCPVEYLFKLLVSRLLERSRRRILEHSMTTHAYVR